VWTSTIAFLLVGAVDGFLAYGRADQAPILQVVLLSAVLWSGFGWLFGLLEQTALILCWGRSTDRRVLSKIVQWVRSSRGARGTEQDRGRAILAVATLFGGIIFLVLSLRVLRHLITHRHGADLIAVTFVVAQIFVAFVALFCGRLCWRGLSALIHRWSHAKWVELLFSTAHLFVALVLGMFVGLIVGFYRFGDIFKALDGFSMLLLLLALTLRPALGLLWDRVGPRRSYWVILPLLVFLGGSYGLSQNERTRKAIVSSSFTAKYLFHQVQSWSDFDGDGAPWFPVAYDCAPFDAKIRPFAKEIPGNGVDEDCDGLDRRVTGYVTPERTRPRLGRPKQIPNFVLITIDATRADHLGLYGYERDISPNLDALAKDSVVFEQAFSQDSGTGPSLWSLMVGKTPFQVELQNAHRFPPRFAPSEKTLAQRLKRSGYATSALLCGAVFATPHWNLRRGFLTYREICGKKKSHQAEGTTKVALKELERLRKRGKPFFLWVHFYDPHDPYQDHEDQDLGARKIDRYDEEIRYTDKEMAPLLDAIRDDAKRPTYLFITADHGENFGEHGRDPHARTLYWEVTRVPLIIHGPKMNPRRIQPVVAMNDIFPTILELAGAPKSETSTMVSLVPVLLGDPPDPERLVFQENSYSRPRRHAKGVIGHGYHMIQDISNDLVELYDLRKDHLEAKNLAGTGLEIEETLQKALNGFIPSTTIPKGMPK